MTYEPTAGHLAVELTRRSAGSARPDAPVVPRARPAPGPAGRGPSPDGRQPAHRRPLGRAQPAYRQGLPAELNATAAGATRNTGSPMAKVTLQSIADRVGVSRMTVSNAFSRPDQLSSELRERILAAADKLGYVGPDPAARALARGRTGSIGLLLTDSSPRRSRTWWRPSS